MNKAALDQSKYTASQIRKLRAENHSQPAHIFRRIVNIAIRLSIVLLSFRLDKAHFMRHDGDFTDCLVNRAVF